MINEDDLTIIFSFIWCVAVDAPTIILSRIVKIMKEAAGKPIRQKQEFVAWLKRLEWLKLVPLKRMTFPNRLQIIIVCDAVAILLVFVKEEVLSKFVMQKNHFRNFINVVPGTSRILT